MQEKGIKQVDLDQQINFLKKIDFFHDFDDHELKQFLAVSKWLMVSEDSLIIRENSIGRGFYIIVQGDVSVIKTKSDTGETIKLTTLSAGDCFGEMSMLSEIKRTAGVITNTEAIILMVEPEIISTSNVFLQLKFYKRFCEILVSRLIAANARVAGQSPQQTAANFKLEEKLVTNGKPAIDERLGVRKKKRLPGDPEAGADAVALKHIKTGALPPMPQKRARMSPLSFKRRISVDECVGVNANLASRLSSFLVGPVEDTRSFAELIMLDPGLSAFVIQMANSSFYRRATPVASVPHAMITIGIKQIQQLIQETLDKSQEIKLFNGITTLSQSFFQHSVFVGKVAEMLRDAIQINISADIYLAGLLHDLGIMALDKVEPRFYPQLSRPEPVYDNLVEAEKEYIGIDHGQAGLWVGEIMGLPKPFLDAMRFHHHPENARENALLVALVHLADTFATSREMSMEGGRAGLTIEEIMQSFGWIIIQEQSPSFIEVNLYNFIASINDEIDKAWDEIMGEILT